MNTGQGTNTKRLAVFGLAALGLAVAAPVHARHDFPAGPFVIAKQERDEEVRRERRDEGRDSRRERREAESDEPRGYGYGYERRQQQRQEEDKRRRGRR